jgi:hypothetical protein
VPGTVRWKHSRWKHACTSLRHTPQIGVGTLDVAEMQRGVRVVFVAFVCPFTGTAVARFAARRGGAAFEGTWAAGDTVWRGASYIYALRRVSSTVYLSSLCLTEALVSGCGVLVV